MTRVVTDKCIDCRTMDCVEVCPVEAFHVGENMVVINQYTCIDCTLCEDTCPTNAIISEYDEHERMDDFIEFADNMSDVWPIVVDKFIPNENAGKHTETKDRWHLRSTKAAQIK